MAENRKDRYKDQGARASKRGERRKETVSLRKKAREKLLSSKRVRYDLEEVDEDDEIDYSPKVLELVASFGKVGDHTGELRALRKLFAKGSRYIEVFLQSKPNAIGSLVHFLSQPCNEQLESAWCITNISAGSPEHTKISMAAAPYLITYLSEASGLLQDQAAWALGNMAGNGPESRDQLLAQGILPALIQLLQSADEAKVVQSTAFAVSNMCRGQNAPITQFLEAGLAPILVSSLSTWSANSEVAAEICWIFVYITAQNPPCQAILAHHGIIPMLVSYLGSVARGELEDPEAIIPVLRVVGNFASGQDEFAQAMMSEVTFLPALLHFIQSPQRHLVLEATWIVSNLAAGPPEHAAALVSAKFLPKLLDLMSLSPEIKREATFTILNIADHGAEAVGTLLQNNTVPAFVNHLKAKDIEILLLGIQFFELILRSCGEAKEAVLETDAADLLESLQFHANADVQNRSHEVVVRYFEDEDEEFDDN